MIFAWNAWNIGHLAKHGVSPLEAEYVISHARNPYPLAIDAAKRLVIGSTYRGRLLHVIFVFKSLDEVEPGSVSSDSLDTEQIAEVIFVIHAMPASSKQKRHHKRRRER